MPNNADGSVILEAKVNVDKAEKDLERLKKKVHQTESDIEDMGKARFELTEKSKELAGALDAAKAKLFEMQQAAKGAFNPQEISDQSEIVKSLQFRYDAVQSQVERYDRNIADATRKLERQTEEAGELVKKINSVSGASRAMAEAQEKAQKSAARFASRLREVIRSALVFTLITQSLAKFREWIGEVLKANEDAQRSFARLKGSLLTLAQPLLDVLIPALITTADVLALIVGRVTELIARLSGTTAEAAAEAAQALNDQAEALEKTGEAAKDASLSMASFDEINKLSSAGGSSSSEKTVEPDFSAVGNSAWLDDALGNISEKVAAGLLLGGVALVAIGAATGSLVLVLAGLTVLNAGIAVGEDAGGFKSWAETLGLESVEQYVASAILLGGIALVAIGAATGNIMMVIAGAGLLGTGIAFVGSNESTQSWIDTLGLDSVFDYVTAAMQLVGIALVAIGACMGNIAMVVAGGVLLGVGVAADAIGEETLSGWWEVLKLTTVQQWVGVALLLVGISLIAIGAAMANIGMILAGALALSVGIAASANEGNLKDWVSVMGLEKVAGWVTAGLLLVGIALVVFGIATGNIMMILAGAGLLGAGIAIGATSGTFSTWLDSIESAFLKFKNKMLETFNGLWGGIKSIINSIAGGIEWMANKVIDGVNWVINAANRIRFNIPDFLGGGSFGLNIQTLDPVKIPRLATGAVIPPNREFLAVLGDQKSGTNIEAPLDTIVQAFKMAMSETYSGGGNTTVILELDGIQFGKAVYKANMRESHRVGVRLSGQY